MNLVKKTIKYLINKIKVENKTKIKEFHEFSFWKNTKESEGSLSNSHYEYFYTEHFGVEKSSYSGKVIMDIGCGPRGSLEWADNAKRRIGVDPLASKYISELGADKHNMEYVSSGSENIPIKKNECDYIFSFNSLDHVENVTETINEIKRCIAEEGVFLLLVEVNHPPTNYEPHMLTPKIIIESLLPEFQAQDAKVYKPDDSGLYASVKLNKKFDDPLNCKEMGWFSAKFIRKNN